MSFKEKTIRIGNWCRNHKIEIITAVSVVGYGVVCGCAVKKICDIANEAEDESLEYCNQLMGEFEFGTFINGVRKLFLRAGENDYVSNIGDSVSKLKDVVGGEDAVGAIRYNDKILCITQGVAAENGGDVIKIVKDIFPGIDDLEIWVGGTIKE